MTRLAALGLAALATSGAAPHAQGLDEIYPRAALVKDQSRFEQRVRDMFERGLWDFMDGAEKEALSGLRLNFPLIGHHRTRSTSTPIAMAAAPRSTCRCCRSSLSRT